MCDKYNKKIISYNNENVFIIFYRPDCMFCINSLKLLKINKLQFKGYNVNNIKNSKNMFDCFKLEKNTTYYNETHRTIPTIFYKGKFIGGYTELKKYINS